jgi:hypothetical protein
MRIILNNIDIILTYSPIDECTGHIFEVFDYYLLLRNYFKCKILLLTKLNIDLVDNALSRYLDNNIKLIKEDLILLNDYKKYKIISVKDSIILITDGNLLSFNNRNIIFNCKKILSFLCFEYDFKNLNNYRNTIFLQDYRIYNKNKYFDSIDYIKKINFDSYKKDIINNKNTALLYLTINCRNLLIKEIEEIVDKYNNFDSIYILSPENKTINNYFKNNTKVISFCPPVNNFFELFDTYIYTPIKRHFDCSPRLITECKFYNKNIIYHNINYKDIGLEIRKKDIQNNFKNLYLTSKDNIINIIKNEKSNCNL